jgi:hypothetical protein
VWRAIVLETLRKAAAEQRLSIGGTVRPSTRSTRGPGDAADSAFVGAFCGILTPVTKPG